MNKRIFALTVALGLASGLAAPGAQAIPAFARQTGQNCNACHVSFPELTPYGRYFKLSGYTLGKPISAYPEDVPLAVMAVVGVSDTRKNTLSDGTTQVDPYNGKVKAQQLSLFLGGKATDHLGAFMQWTAAPNPDTGGYDFGADNADIRLVNTRVAPGGQEPDLIYGLTVNNNPTVQDVWNTVPAWGFPYMASGTSITGPYASPMIENLAGTAGVGGYVYWKQSIYAELSAYRTADGLLSFFNVGNDHVYVQGYNPYWRLAYSKDWGPDSMEVGTYGMVADVYPDPVGTGPTGPTDRFKDYGVDAQYQHITDLNTWTAQASYTHETEDWNASFATLGATSNATDTLNNFKVKGSYWYRHKYGASLGYFSSTGSSDATLYGGAGSLNDKPDSAGYVFEADYMPWDYVRLAAQYNAYTKYLGGSTYDDQAGGAPRNASDNNSLFLYVWVAY